MATAPDPFCCGSYFCGVIVLPFLLHNNISAAGGADAGGRSTPGPVRTCGARVTLLPAIYHHALRFCQAEMRQEMAELRKEMREVRLSP